jgi:hypothetical protein
MTGGVAMGLLSHSPAPTQIAAHGRRLRRVGRGQPDRSRPFLSACGTLSLAILAPNPVAR